MNFYSLFNYLIIGYVGIVIYAGAALLLRDLVAFFTVVTMGIPAILYLTLEWVATPMLAALTGFTARWSLIIATLGIPLVVLFTLVTPVVAGPALGVPVPWLSFYTPKNESYVLQIATERFVWWGSIYLIAALIGRVSRLIKPCQEA